MSEYEKPATDCKVNPREQGMIFSRQAATGDSLAGRTALASCTILTRLGRFDASGLLSQRLILTLLNKRSIAMSLDELKIEVLKLQKL